MTAPAIQYRVKRSVTVDGNRLQPGQLVSLAPHIATVLLASRHVRKVL